MSLDNQETTEGGTSDPYMDAVRRTADVPIAFIDPDAFNRSYYDANKRVDPADIPLLRQMIEDQVPGGAGPNVPDADLERVIERALVNGPFGQRLEIAAPAGDPDGSPTPFGIVNLQGDQFDNARDEYMPTVVSLPPELMRELPGTEEEWDTFWGIHEGTHPNQPVYDALPTDELRATEIMRRELESDMAGIAWLRSRGRDDMAQAIIDYRALSTLGDPLHAATAVLADEPGAIPTVEHFQAARKFEGVMNGIVAQDLGINAAEVFVMGKTNPVELAEHVQRLLDAGAFDQADPNPHIREFIEAYAGAVQRQVLDRRTLPQQELQREGSVVEPERHADNGYPVNARFAGMDVAAISGGSAVVALADGDGTRLTLGGVSAPAFFAAHSDPALALQRLEMLQAEQPAVDTAFKATAAAPALS